MKHTVIALTIIPKLVYENGRDVDMVLPADCVGLMPAFESKKAARESVGEKVELCRIYKHEAKNDRA